MASIEKRGKSYRISVSDGYFSKGRKNIERMTWTPPEGMKESKADQEALKKSYEFEAKVKNGHFLNGEKITFAEFAELWLKDHAEKQLKPKTVEGYRILLKGRILPAIGHIKLSKLQPTHLIKLISALQVPGLNQCVKYKAKPDIRKTWQDSGMTAIKAEISRHTLTPILMGNNVNKQTADKMAKALNKPVKDLFDKVGDAKTLSNNTVRHYMRCISSILSVAVEWQLIESNPCDRVRAPKVPQKLINHLEIDQAQALIDSALKLDKMRIQTAVLVFLYTGIRKGELSGLRWSDFDFDNGTITIQRTIQQIDGRGLVVSSTKTESGERMISISEGLIEQLRRHKIWQAEERLKVGDKWQGKELLLAKQAGIEFQPIDWVFTNLDGYPLHPSTIYHWIKPFLVENGHPGMTVHGLRHTNISIMLGQGVDLITAAKRAGHAKPSTTANIYAHALRRPDEAAADKLDTLFNPSSADTV